MRCTTERFEELRVSRRRSGGGRVPTYDRQTGCYLFLFLFFFSLFLLPAAPWYGRRCERPEVTAARDGGEGKQRYHE